MKSIKNTVKWNGSKMREWDIERLQQLSLIAEIPKKSTQKETGIWEKKSLLALLWTEAHLAMAKVDSPWLVRGVK